MSDAAYIPGELARLSLRVADIDGTAADPGALLLKIKGPSGTVATFTYGIGADIVRDGLGAYHADLPLATAGLWAYRWELAAPNAGAAEGVINVQKSRVI